MKISLAHPVAEEWFHSRLGTPTEAQMAAWPAISSGRDTLVAAPTGSGKTLAAFFWCLEGLIRRGLDEGALPDRTEIVYVSPLKALANDVQKNLEGPLGEMTALAAERGLRVPPIRVAVRSGDTPASERRRLALRPPHILVTTPESLFILLTSESGRRGLSTARTVIVDEIHAVAADKRGAHLALSLERLERLVTAAGNPRPVRIGLSATQRPIEEVARFLVGASRIGAGGAPECTIVDVGHRRRVDLAIEVPADELSAVASNEMWAETYDRIADLIREHRTTIVFVNTRRLVERVAHQLEARLGERAVAAHHGSLSRKTRLDAEQRLKSGELRAIVATASLELGIDVGAVDLVCQVGSPRAIRTLLQRVGRSGHTVGGLPKGRLFALTRDQLVECAALVRAARAGALDRIEVRRRPLDILAQQVVAMAASEDWDEEDLFALCRRAYPYAPLSRKEFDEVIVMLSEGIATQRGRATAHLHRDLVNGRIRGRRGARLAAITSGGAIPDVADYDVVSEPEDTFVGKVDEDFAVESMRGDIFLLGNTSWQILRVEAGRVRVADAKGRPPTIPFWRAEAPSRTAELSAAVAELRAEIEGRLETKTAGAGNSGRVAGGTVPGMGLPPSTVGFDSPRPLPDVGSPGLPPSAKVEDSTSSAASQSSSVAAWLERECSLPRAGAEQLVAYIAATRAALGAVPTQRRIVAERFFDEAGGMQLILHAPFGGRVNRAWGLALRKRFCRTFDFELQAAATDDGIVLSLGPHHSFPLDSVFRFLRADSVGDLLAQAVLPAPMFGTRWRWTVTRALALLRFQKGRKVPPPLQRIRAEDLLAAVFPRALACGENYDSGDIPIPEHPLVAETLRDCFEEAMDLEGLRAVLAEIERGGIETVARDTPEPSPMSHEILNANPYAFLDDAPLEERRARAVATRRGLPTEVAGSLGALDPEAIEAVAREAWPEPRNPDELHDVLLSVVALPEAAAGSWRPFADALLSAKRATWLRAAAGGRALVAAERLPVARMAYPGAGLEPPIDAPKGSPAPADEDEAAAAIVRGWLSFVGPQTEAGLARTLLLPLPRVRAALARIESEGQVLRGRFTPGLPDGEIEWCDRGLLARIHRRTIGRLRREIEPVSTQDFMRFLLRWQHVAPGTQLHGEEGLLRAIEQLQGFEAAAGAWEEELLRARVAGYQPPWLDALCLGGEVAWGRLSGRRAQPGARPAQLAGRAAPIALALRQDLPWLLDPEAPGLEALSHPARAVHDHLAARGASFFPEILAGTGRLRTEVEEALSELVAAGLVTADGFQALRALLDRGRRDRLARTRRALGKPRARDAQGRWVLLRGAGPTPEPPAQAPELHAHQLLRRYGVVLRDLLAREPRAPAWRELLPVYRRLEARGELRGGRFVAGPGGEQFALPSAVEALRAMRRAERSGEVVRVSASDPLNLAGILTPGARIPAVIGHEVRFRDGVPVVPAQSPAAAETEAHASSAASALPPGADSSEEAG